MHVPTTGNGARATRSAAGRARPQGLPPKLVPYLRMAHATDRGQVATAAEGIADPDRAAPLSESNEAEALHHLAHYLTLRLARCAAHPIVTNFGAMLHALLQHAAP